MEFDITKIDIFLKKIVKGIIEIFASYIIFTLKMWLKPYKTMRLVLGVRIKTYDGLLLTPLIYFFINVLIIYFLSLTTEIKIDEGFLFIIDKKLTNLQSFQGIIMQSLNFLSGFICFATMFAIVMSFKKCPCKILDIIDSMCYASAFFIPLYFINIFLGSIFNIEDILYSSMNNNLIPISKEAFFFPEVNWARGSIPFLLMFLVSIIKYCIWGYVFIIGMGNHIYIEKREVVTSTIVSLLFMIVISQSISLYKFAVPVLQLRTDIKIADEIEREENITPRNYGKLYALNVRLASSDRATLALQYRIHIRAITYLLGTAISIDSKRALVDYALDKYELIEQETTTVDQGEEIYKDILNYYKVALQKSLEGVENKTIKNSKEYHYLLEKIKNHIAEADKIRSNPQYDMYDVAIKWKWNSDNAGDKEKINKQSSISEKKTNFNMELIP